jgi:hypothetical protein
VEPARKLQAFVGGSAGAQVLNLGARGAMVEHAIRLLPGHICTFSLHLGGLDLRIQARVAWSQVYSTSPTLPGERQLRFRSGLSFLLPEAAEAHLQRCLAAWATPRSPTPSDVT